MGVFLTAEWRNLLMANYKIKPSILTKLLPSHTELDYWEGDCYVSLIGFLFKDTKIKGLGFPYHKTFEEINLRFYVRHFEDGEWRRGVVFIKEIVPKPMITFIANTLYDENYVTLPTKHSWEIEDDYLHVNYSWKDKNWQSIAGKAAAIGQALNPGSAEEFITEHYWGYAQNKRGFTTEYAVEHPRWNIHPVESFTINCNFLELYGEEIANAMEKEPTSVFLADGSPIKIMDGRRLDA